MLVVAAPARAADETGAPEVVVRGDARRPELSHEATSTVRRREMDERLPRSSPDALRYEPGVFVQQTGHGQASPFVRGRTGQQIVIHYDGVRLNNSSYRQGPNQYFFTLDAATIQSITVVRGGASTLYGSDALGGAILAEPVEPAPTEEDGVFVRPRTRLRYATADSDFGERFQVDTQVSRDLRALVGVGHRKAGQLTSGGEVRSPVDGSLPRVPQFEADGRTQRGTGFRELTGDGRLAYRVNARMTLTAAANAYREYDAPRTDQCPPAFAPRDECLVYDEQFRTLAYLGLDGDLGPAASKAKLRLSYQRQHERRTRSRPVSFVKNAGRDDVRTLGVSALLSSDRFQIQRSVSVRATYGADLYNDALTSSAYIDFTNTRQILPAARGQYLNGSTYLQGGAFAQGELLLGKHVQVSGGGRAGIARATAPSDGEGGSAALDRTWPLLAGHGGAAFSVAPALSLLLGLDRSFRAPNLDDLTSRQQTGPGFQFENPALGPESQITTEAGARWETEPLRAELWGFRSNISHGILRAARTVAQCPPATDQCASSWSRYQLINAAGPSVIYGLEAVARARPGRDVTLRATAAYTWGEGPNPGIPPREYAVSYTPTVPLSRIPPLNGTAEARWAFARAFYAGGAIRWAFEQTRLAISDRTDARIPRGGTPGFAVFDLRAGYRVDRLVVVHAVFENVFDSPYRYHGSSVNGAGRGVITSLEIGL